MANSTTPAYTLRTIDHDADHEFKIPIKRINDGDDVSFFLTSKAYTDIMTFIFQLNGAMFPQKSRNAEGESEIKEWNIKDTASSPPEVFLNLAKLVRALEKIIDEAPPDPGPRRFGNVSFRKWHGIVQERISGLLDEYLPSEVLSRKSKSDVTAKVELEAYLMGSFGSAQRLDYGTGHELSFLAFLGGLWKLNAFPIVDDGSSERFIVLGVVEPYLELIRRLILTYSLEPAGSHGVWGLDDHSFLPYIFGSAQFSPGIAHPSEIVTEGSLPNAPNPADVAKAPAVERERARNMYFSAIGFIYDVKKGPFWEHSPILFDISGVKAGWAKINKGMLKMYNAEVLSKFPVVQHFPFGSLFTWETDPSAKQIQESVHTASQPKSNAPTARPQAALRDPLAEPGMSTGMPPASSTAAPWASSRIPSRQPASVPVPAGPNQPTRAPWASSTPLPPSGTTAPWANAATQAPGAMPSTRAPWADRKS